MCAADSHGTAATGCAHRQTRAGTDQSKARRVRLLRRRARRQGSKASTAKPSAHCVPETFRVDRRSIHVEVPKFRARRPTSVGILSWNLLAKRYDRSQSWEARFCCLRNEWLHRLAHFDVLCFQEVDPDTAADFDSLFRHAGFENVASRPGQFQRCGKAGKHAAGEDLDPHSVVMYFRIDKLRLCWWTRWNRSVAASFAHTSRSPQERCSRGGLGNGGDAGDERQQEAEREFCVVNLHAKAGLGDGNTHLRQAHLQRIVARLGSRNRDLHAPGAGARASGGGLGNVVITGDFNSRMRPGAACGAAADSPSEAEASEAAVLVNAGLVNAYEDDVRRGEATFAVKGFNAALDHVWFAKQGNLRPYVRLGSSPQSLARIKDLGLPHLPLWPSDHLPVGVLFELVSNTDAPGGCPTAGATGPLVDVHLAGAVPVGTQAPVSVSHADLAEWRQICEESFKAKHKSGKHEARQVERIFLSLVTKDAGAMSMPLEEELLKKKADWEAAWAASARDPESS